MSEPTRLDLPREGLQEDGKDKQILDNVDDSEDDAGDDEADKYPCLFRIGVAGPDGTVIEEYCRAVFATVEKLQIHIDEMDPQW